MAAARSPVRQSCECSPQTNIAPPSAASTGRGSSAYRGAPREVAESPSGMAMKRRLRPWRGGDALVDFHHGPAAPARPVRRSARHGFQDVRAATRTASATFIGDTSCSFTCGPNTGNAGSSSIHPAEQVEEIVVLAEHDRGAQNRGGGNGEHALLAQRLGTGT